MLVVVLSYFSVASPSTTFMKVTSFPSITKIVLIVILVSTKVITLLFCVHIVKKRRQAKKYKQLDDDTNIEDTSENKNQNAKEKIKLKNSFKVETRPSKSPSKLKASASNTKVNSPNSNQSNRTSTSSASSYFPLESVSKPRKNNFVSRYLKKSEEWKKSLLTKENLERREVEKILALRLMKRCGFTSESSDSENTIYEL